MHSELINIWEKQHFRSYKDATSNMKSQLPTVAFNVLYRIKHLLLISGVVCIQQCKICLKVSTVVLFPAHQIFILNTYTTCETIATIGSPMSPSPGKKLFGHASRLKIEGL